MTSRQVAALLVADIAEGVRVLRTRDGVPLTDEQVDDRARNIVAGLVGNYAIRSLDDDARQIHKSTGSMSRFPKAVSPRVSRRAR